VTVIGTCAGKGVNVTVGRDPHVTELGVHQSVEQLPADTRPPADPRPDRDVAEGVEALGGAPAMLAERGGVDVRVERDRYREPPPDLGSYGRVCPPLFWCRRDVPRGGG